MSLKMGKMKIVWLRKKKKKKKTGKNAAVGLLLLFQIRRKKLEKGYRDAHASLTFPNSLFHSPTEWGCGTKIPIPKSEKVAASHPAPAHSK